MKIEVLTRFNEHDPGDVFEAKDADARKWIKNGLAKKTSKLTAEESAAAKAKADEESAAAKAKADEEKKKAPEGPAKDKQVKDAPVKK